MKKAPIILLSLFILFTACDPMQVLTIEVKKKRNASVTIYANKKFLSSSENFEPGSYNYNKYKPDSSGKLIIHLSEQDPFFGMSFGIGDWQSDEVVNLAGDIDSIVFMNSRRRRVLKGEDDIIPYLWGHRRGYPFKNRIYIKAK